MTEQEEAEAKIINAMLMGIEAIRQGEQALEDLPLVDQEKYRREVREWWRQTCEIMEPPACVIEALPKWLLGSMQ